MEKYTYDRRVATKSDLSPHDLKRGLNLVQIDHPEYGTWVVSRENPPGTWEVHKSRRPSDGIAVAESELMRFWRKAKPGDKEASDRHKIAILENGPVGRVLNEVWNQLHDIQYDLDKTDQDYQDAAHFSGRPAEKDALAMIKKIKTCVEALNTLTHKTLNDLAKAEADFVKKYGEPGDYSDRMRAEIFPH